MSCTIIRFERQIYINASGSEPLNVYKFYRENIFWPEGLQNINNPCESLLFNTNLAEKLSRISASFLASSSLQITNYVDNTVLECTGPVCPLSHVNEEIEHCAWNGHAKNCLLHLLRWIEVWNSPIMRHSFISSLKGEVCTWFYSLWSGYSSQSRLCFYTPEVLPPQV